MIIPNSTGKVIEFTIPHWILTSSLSLIALLVVGMVVSSSSLYYKSSQLNIVQETVSALKEENQYKTEEIAILNHRSIEIEEQLASLNELRDQVLDKVGLESSQYLKGMELKEPFFIVSRSNQRSSSIGNYEDQNEEEDMDYLKLLIENQKATMDQLLEDVEQQLQHLEALPNLTPAPGRISSPFGYRISPINNRREFHSGMDIANSTNTDIVAAGSGVVTYSGYNGGYGRMVVISHGDGYSSVYAHNTRNLVEVGQRVKEGEVIAKMGSTGRSTGPHVHFEVRLNGEPIDPMGLLKD
ncbi:MAG: M23 family metallopeptidase [Clostridiaceae bacterium]|nr:M23 family metallopeptidase [Clostridiaceae bacterium]